MQRFKNSSFPIYIYIYIYILSLRIDDIFVDTFFFNELLGVRKGLYLSFNAFWIRRRPRQDYQSEYSTSSQNDKTAVRSLVWLELKQWKSKATFRKKFSKRKFSLFASLENLGMNSMKNRMISDTRVKECNIIFFFSFFFIRCVDDRSKQERKKKEVTRTKERTAVCTGRKIVAIEYYYLKWNWQRFWPMPSDRHLLGLPSLPVGLSLYIYTVPQQQVADF